MTLTHEDIAVAPITINRVRTFIDEHTGRTVRQLTDCPDGAYPFYFRRYCNLPDGRMLIGGNRRQGVTMLLDPASGDLTVPSCRFRPLKLREADGHAWFIRAKDPHAPREKRLRTGRELWQIDLPDGSPEFIADIPDALPGMVEDITIDGRCLVANEHEEDLATYPPPTTQDPAAMERYFGRPRRGGIWVYDIAAGDIRQILETPDYCPVHVDTSPLDPALLRYASDRPETRAQRIHTLRLDGSDHRPIRPQQRGEMVTHEFWWSDPRYIGYTYQDRRADPTVQTHHWAEYALADTRLGIANLAGREVYLSDPLNSYHSHLYRSVDGTLVSGEGSDGCDFVYAARFSMDSTRVEMVALASLHSPYVPFRGRAVECHFSADNRWLIYGDQPGPGEPHQVFAVEVDV